MLANYKWSCYNEKKGANGMKVLLDGISATLSNRYLTLERNICAASNSFYDAYLDFLEEFVKTVAHSARVESGMYESCGSLLGRDEVRYYLTADCAMDDLLYRKLQDYVLKVNRHKHRREKQVACETVLSYMEVLYRVVSAFSTGNGGCAVEFDRDRFRHLYGLFERENRGLRVELEILRDQLSEAVQSRTLSESDLEQYRRQLSDEQISRMNIEEQNRELRDQISRLKDIRLHSMEEKLNRTIDLLLELKPAIVENRILLRAVGRTVGGLINGDRDVDAWIAREKEEGDSNAG